MKTIKKIQSLFRLSASLDEKKRSAKQAAKDLVARLPAQTGCEKASIECGDEIWLRWYDPRYRYSLRVMLRDNEDGPKFEAIVHDRCNEWCGSFDEALEWIEEQRGRLEEKSR